MLLELDFDTKIINQTVKSKSISQLTNDETWKLKRKISLTKKDRQQKEEVKDWQWCHIMIKTRKWENFIYKIRQIGQNLNRLIFNCQLYKKIVMSKSIPQTKLPQIVSVCSQWRFLTPFLLSFNFKVSLFS